MYAPLSLFPISSSASATLLRNCTGEVVTDNTERHRQENKAEDTEERSTDVRGRVCCLIGQLEIPRNKARVIAGRG